MPWKILGKMLGLNGGGAVRNAFEQILAAFGFDRTASGTPAQDRVTAFTVSVVTLAAKMSKADRISSEVEVAAFERLFDVPEGERNNLRRVFDLACQDVAGYETYARRIGDMLDAEPDLKIFVLESLLHMATADGIHHPAEEVFLAFLRARATFAWTAPRAICCDCFEGRLVPIRDPRGTLPQRLSRVTRGRRARRSGQANPAADFRR